MLNCIRHCEKYGIYKVSKRYLQRSICLQKDDKQYQYMQCSQLPTLYFQQSLPHLPIPQLNLTCERFLSAVKPLLSEEEYRDSVKMASAFRSSDGAELQRYLQHSDAANKHTSYVSQPWFDMYLSDRSPLPLYYNPLLIMNATANQQQSQILRAANLVISSLRFWKSLQADLLEPEVFHLNPKKTNTQGFRKAMKFVPKSIATYAAYTMNAYPLDMSQYSRLFGVSRIPKVGKDVLVQNKNSKHILVMCGGNMYAVDVLDINGNIELPEIILARLQTTLQMAKTSGVAAVPVGALTALNRDEWAAAREHLISNVGGGANNKHILEKEIDAALFCLCLDGNDEPVFSEDNMAPLLKHLLAGHGRNRWFDKSVSLIVSADGTASVNFEHSWGDGVAVLRYFNDVYKDTSENTYATGGNAVTAELVNAQAVRRINLKTDQVVESAVKKAVHDNITLMDELDIDVLQYPLINKAICKEHALSPDAVMQLSFQLAYKRAYNAYVGTYESCSTAAFRHGRTETVRPCSVATKAFCESNQQKQSDPIELFNLIKQCSALHSKLTREAAMGQGFDRHLFALKHQALAHNKRLPTIYESKAYTNLNYNIISTSTLSSDALLAGCFGPVVQDGLGVAYSINEQRCGAVVSSFKKHRNGKEFLENLKIALDQIYEILKIKSNATKENVTKEEKN